MSEPGLDPRTAALRHEIAQLRSSLDDLGDTLRAINDPVWRDAFLETLKVGYSVIDLHAIAVQPSIADDAAGLRSALQRHSVPREDSSLGPLDSLKTLRGARSTVIADAEAVLAAAEALGMKPTQLNFTPPAELQVGTAGLTGMLLGLTRRLDSLTKALSDFENQPEGESVQQTQIGEYYVRSMAVEIALAKLETSSPVTIDFAGLSRSVDRMAELTGDLLSTVKSVPALFSEYFRKASNLIIKKVSHVAIGFRAIVYYAFRSGTARIAKSDPEIPVDATSLFWELIATGDAAFQARNWFVAKVEYQRAHRIAESFVSKSPENLEWQRNFSLSQDKLRDAEYVLGKDADHPFAVNTDRSINYVYIVDDDIALRRSLKDFLLRDSSYTVIEYTTGDDFLNNVKDIWGGVVILDFYMPGANGLDVMRAIGEDDRFRVIMVTGAGNVTIATEAMKLGASDFLEKPFDPDYLRSAISRSFADLDSSHKKAERTVAAKKRLAKLSPRETEVLKSLMEGRSNKVIAYELDISPRTVEIYRANLMDKLEVRTLSEAVRTAFLGWGV